MAEALSLMKNSLLQLLCPQMSESHSSTVSSLNTIRALAWRTTYSLISVQIHNKISVFMGFFFPIEPLVLQKEGRRIDPQPCHMLKHPGAGYCPPRCRNPATKGVGGRSRSPLVPSPDKREDRVRKGIRHTTKVKSISGAQRSAVVQMKKEKEKH